MKNKEEMFEKDILDSFEKGEWQSIPDLKEEIARYASCAAAQRAARPTGRGKKPHAG